MKIRRILILLSIFAYIDFLGLVNSENFLRIKNLFKFYDLLIIFIIFYTIIYSIFRYENLKRVSNLPTGKYIKIILVFILIVVLSMPFRFGESIISALKIARYYFPFFLFFIVMIDIIETESSQFIYNLILSIGTILSIIFIVGLFLPNLINTLIPNVGLVIQDTEHIELQRYYTPGFLFPFASIFILNDIIIHEKNEYIPIHNKIIFFINLIGCILQGFRAYIIIGIFSFMILFFIANKLDIKKYVKILFLTFLIIGFFNILLFPGFLSNRISSGFSDLIHKKGTFEFRLVNDYFRFFLFEEHPIIGIGFIDANSDIGKNMGLEIAGEFSAYTTDSGYLTLLVSFGVLGTLFYTFILIRIFLRNISIVKDSESNARKYAISSSMFMILLFFTIITHGGLYSPYGLVPLVLLLSISEGGYLLYTMNKVRIE